MVTTRLARFGRAYLAMKRILAHAPARQRQADLAEMNLSR
jgi:hypothetical protein